MKVSQGSLLILLIVLAVSCDYLPFQNKKDLVPLDTIVDFSTVDSPPTFDLCKSLIEKEKKNTCFRNTLSDLVSKELQSDEFSEDFVVRSEIDELINLKIQFDKNGALKIKDLKLSNELNAHIPEMDSILYKVIQKLPKVYPAIKRGIPVVTEYTLPVRIKL